MTASSQSTSSELAAPVAVWKLFILRFFAMLSYSMTYVAVPALLFKGSKSTTVAGLALMAEGVIRAGVSLLARRLHGRLGSRTALLLAEGMRLAGGVALLVCLWQFNIVLLVLASCTYQFGYLTVVFEQELRCGQLGAQTLKGQSSYRAAEVAAVFPVLAAAFAFAGFKVPLLPLVALGSLGAAVHLGLARLWLQGNSSLRAHAGSALQGFRFLLGRPDLRRGVLASTLAFSVFALALSAAPFLLKGHTVFGFSTGQQAGLACYKAGVASLALVLTFGMAKVLRTAAGPTALVTAGVIAPLALAASQFISSGLAATLVLCVAPAFAVTILMAQRSRRQQQIPAAQQSDVTTAYLAVECLSMIIAGAVLASGWVVGPMLGIAVVLLWAQTPRAAVP